MTKRIYVDRSRVETAAECARRRWWEYHEQNIGIVPRRKALALAVGGAVHEGLAVLLLGRSEDDAVADALADFAEFRGALDAEAVETVPTVGGTAAQAETTFEPVQAAEATGTTEGDLAVAEGGRSPFDDYLFAEQSALVEGLVRAWARRRLRPLLEEYEVLEVEREGEWLLSSYQRSNMESQSIGPHVVHMLSFEDIEIWFMSRPDALLLERRTGQLVLQSFKTCGELDVRRKKDAEHDMQGLSEGVEIERRLAAVWSEIHSSPTNDVFDHSGREAMKAKYGERMWEFLWHQPSPPRISAIRYEFLVKGERWRDKELAARFGFDARAQRSVLVRGYSDDRGGWNCSWDYRKEDGTASKLNYRQWKSAPVWESMTVREWIDRLDAMAPVTAADADSVALDVRELGWGGAAQTTGYATEHPLDAVLPPAVIVYRQDDELLDWVEQVEASERRIAEGVAAVEGARDEGARRSALNVHFPMNRRSCQWPSECHFVKLCFGGDDIRRDPLGSGLYKVRTPNHPIEGTAQETKETTCS